MSLFKRTKLLSKGGKIKLSKKATLGEWDNNMNAFRFGANNCEWIAWKGSHQVFVYPCEKCPQLPSQVIQHTNRIETLEDFSEAIYTGAVYEPTYQKVKVYWQE